MADKSVAGEYLVSPPSATAAALAALAIACLAPAPQVCAQARAQGNSGAIEEILVTATKRETGLQQTPIAISAFTGAQLDRAGVNDLQDIDLFTPGLFIGGNASFGSNGYSIRGIGSTLVGMGGDDGVGIYVDGIFQGRGAGAIFEFADLERVEVLRGPQGTLYGRNATGGAINIISIEPGDEFQGKLSVQSTSYNGFGAKGYLIMPLVEGTLSAKVSAAVFDREGHIVNPFWNNRFGGASKNYFSGALRWTPGERSDITLMAYTGSSMLPIVAKNKLNDFPGQINTVAADFRTEERREFSSVNLSGTFHFDRFQADVVLGFLESDVEGFVDSDSTPTDNVQFRNFEEAEQFSVELRLTSDADGRFRWLGGLYYYDEKPTTFTPFNFFRTVIPGFESATASPQGILFAAYLQTQALAAFGELTYDLTDKITLTAGLRYSDEEKDWRGCFLPGAFTRYETDFDPGACGGRFVPDSNSEAVITPKFLIDYQASEGVLLWASATRGFRSGGWNFTEPTIPGVTGFGRESVWSYEAGAKMAVLDGRGRLNVNAFFADYEDLQVRVTDPVTSLLNVSNAGTAEIKGVELEARYSPNQSLDLAATVSWLDAKYTAFSFVQTDGSLVNHAGRFLNRAPEYSFSFMAQYTASINESYELMPRIEWQHTGEMFHSELNVQPFGSEAFNIVNARLRMEPKEGRWAVEAFVDNVGDKQFRQHSFVGILPNVAPGYWSNPRIAGLRASVDF